MRPVLIGVGFLALLVGWLMGTPLAQGPDEPSHYYKALGAAHGQWTGETVVTPGPAMTEHDRVLATLTGGFRLPPSAALQPGAPGQGIECVSYATSAACQEEPPPEPASEPVPLPGTWDGPAPLGPPPASGLFPSYVAPYPPFAYLPLGLAARLGDDGPNALRLARGAGAALCGLLLLGAARCARPPAAAIGLLVAVTPMTLFLSATVNTSGLEIAGAACVGATVLALARGDTGREVWAWLALGGVVLATSRVFGPAWVGVYAGLLAVLLGRRGLSRLVRERPWAAGATAAGVGLAVGASLAWLVLRTPSLGGDPVVMLRLVGPALDALPARLEQAIGRFGWTTVPMPTELADLARRTLGGLLILALLAGTWRHRLALVGMLAATVASTVAVEVITQAPFGYFSQARYTMAAAVGVPLLCGHVLAERAATVPRWLLAPVLAALGLSAAAVHLGGWYTASRQSAMGRAGPRRFLSAPPEAIWQPVGGWTPWLLAAAAGATALAVAGLWAGVQAAAPPPSPRTAAAAPAPGVSPERARPTATPAPSPAGPRPGISDSAAGQPGANAFRPGAAAPAGSPGAGTPSPAEAPGS